MLGDRRGVTALEYAMMGALIGAVIAVSVFSYSGGLGSMMVNTFGTLTKAI